MRPRSWSLHPAPWLLALLSLAVPLAGCTSILGIGQPTGDGDAGAVVGPPADPTRSTVTVAPAADLVADGVATATITVTLVDANGLALAGREVQLTATGTSNTFVPPTPVTGADGKAQAALSTVRAETKTIETRAGNVTLTQHPDVGFVAGPPSPTLSTVSADPTSVPADGAATATVTVTLVDAFGNPVAGRELGLAATGEDAIVVAPLTVTDAAGQAAGTIAARLPGVRGVHAFVDPATPGEIRLQAAADVTFEAPSAPEVISLAVAPSSGCVPVAYAIRQAQARRVDVLVEIDDGTGFRRARQAASATSDGVTGVTSSTVDVGASHSFSWNSTADLGAVDASVTFRVTASAGASSSAPRTFGPVAISNTTGSTCAAPPASGAAGLGTFESPSGLFTGDFDGDGKPDVLRSVFPNRIVIAIGLGDGSFTIGDVATGLGQGGVIAADFDQDGRLDAALANRAAGFVEVLFGNGDLTFDAPTSIDVSSDPAQVIVADLDDDGFPDLVSLNQTIGASASVVLSNGDGSFRPPLSIPDTHATGAAGDLDEDGRTDLIIGYAGGQGGASVFFGLGDGRFSAPVHILSGGEQVSGLAVADLDGDGHLDVAAASRAEDGVEVLRGHGDGSFDQAILVPSVVHAVDVLAVDVDDDDRTDLVVSGCPEGAVGVHRGKGDGTFETVRTTSVGFLGCRASAADYDADGHLDLASSNGVVLLGDGSAQY